MHFALQLFAIIAICNHSRPKTYYNLLYLKALSHLNSWHEDCSNNSLPSMHSEMTAMNSTLILLNALALAVLVIFHFQPVTPAGIQNTDVASTYDKPAPPTGQLAVMSDTSRATPQVVTDALAAPQNPSGERWAF